MLKITKECLKKTASLGEDWIGFLKIVQYSKPISLKVLGFKNIQPTYSCLVL